MYGWSYDFVCLGVGLGSLSLAYPMLVDRKEWGGIDCLPIVI